MEQTTLYPPIAAATVVFILWAIVAYRLYKRDAHRGPGNESFAQSMWLLIVPAALIAFMYIHGQRPISTPVQIFMTALTGIAMGSLGVFTIKQAFFTKFEHRRQRVIAVVQMAVILSLFFVAPFAT